MRSLILFVVCGAIIAPACADHEAEDGENDSFTDEGKQDALGAVDGTPHALGALLVANRSTKNELLSAGVASNAATKIVERRPFATLADLDDAPYVGPTTYNKLKAAAEARGWAAPSFYAIRNSPAPQNRLIPRRDGTMTVLAKEAGLWVMVTDFGTGLQKRMKFSEDLSMAYVWGEARDGTLYTITSNNSRLVSMKPSELAPDSEGNPVKVVLWRRGFQNFAIDDTDGSIYLTYVEGLPTPGTYLRKCTPDGDCTPGEMLSGTPRVGSRWSATAMYGGDVYVAIANPDAKVEIHRGHPGAWTRQDLQLPANIGEVELVVGKDDLLLSASTSPDYSSTRGLILMSNQTNWGTVALPPNLIADGFQVRLVRDHGIMIHAWRAFDRKTWLSSEIKKLRIGRLLDQKDGFEARDLTVQDWHASMLLATGEVAAFDQVEFTPYVEVTRTRGKPIRWRDPNVGAGTLEHRDPCWYSDRPTARLYPRALADVTVDGGGSTELTVPAGQTYTIPAGSCVHIDLIAGDGELVIAGTADKPVHLLGTTLAIRRVRASYAFFDDSPFPLFNGSSAQHFGVDGELDHVSVARERNVHRSNEPAYGWSTVPSLWVDGALPVAKRLIVRNSDFGPLAGDAIRLPPSTSVEVYDTSFHHLAGTAISVANGGLDDTTLKIERVMMKNVHAGVRSVTLSDERRSEILTHWSSDNPTARQAVLARLGTPFQGATTPIDIRDLTIDGTFEVPDDPRPQPAIWLQTPTGAITNSTVTGAATDGVQIHDAGVFAIERGRYAENGRHGIAIHATPPRGLGPCVDPPETYYPPPPPPPRDPAVVDAVIEGNTGNGVFVSGPHILMTVQRNQFRENRLAGFTINSGRGISGRQMDAACGTGGYHDEAEVDLPLAADTTIDNNNFVDNGADEDGIQLRSDHRLGTLPITMNWWGVAPSQAANKVRCTGACNLDPSRSAPIP